MKRLLILDSDDPSKFLKTIRHIRKCRRMWVFDDRFHTLVALVDGYAYAAAPNIIRQFRTWISKEVFGHDSGHHWAPIVASIRYPWVLERERTLEDAPIDDQLKMAEDLFIYLEKFLTEELMVND